MHVVHVYDGHEQVHDGRGSVPDVVWNLAERTAGRGHDVTIIERQWRGLATEAEHEGVSFRRVSLRTGTDKPWTDIPYEMIDSPMGALRLVADRTNFAVTALRTLRSLDADIVHVHLPFAANVLVMLAPWFRDRMVYTAHLGETTERVEKAAVSPDVVLAKRVARTIALNPSMRAAFEKRGVPPDRLTVVPNGVDPDQFEGVSQADREKVARRYELNGDQVVLFVGTVTPRKGVEELVAAVEGPLRNGTDAHLLVVGRTDLEEEFVDDVQEAVADAGLTYAVTFTGFVEEEELAACYDLADVFAFPSYEEGSSVAIMEAIAAGLPVVGSDIDGVTQQIDDGTHGLLVDPGDVDGLSQALQQVLEDDDRRAAMAAALNDRAQGLSWDRVTDRIVDVYGEVAGA